MSETRRYLGKLSESFENGQRGNPLERTTDGYGGTLARRHWRNGDGMADCSSGCLSASRVTTS